MQINVLKTCCKSCFLGVRMQTPEQIHTSEPLYNRVKGETPITAYAAFTYLNTEGKAHNWSCI